jgi:ADP-ribose pyrophosphatase YjhB (NUDIX family)
LALPKIFRDMAWLGEEDYRWIQDSVPIACVDIVPLRVGARGEIESIGLIYRDTPHQGRRWCLVGGRVLRNETLATAAARQLCLTLGDAIRFHIDPDAQPVYVSQYFTSRQPVGVIDPRQHSITVNYCVDIAGEVQAQGEALDFRWFAPQSLPGPDHFGFEQDLILKQCLHRRAAGLFSG